MKSRRLVWWLNPPTEGEQTGQVYPQTYLKIAEEGNLSDMPI